MRRLLFAVCLFAAMPVLAQPLRTGTEASFPPHAMPKLSGGAEGFNIDLGNALAQQLKRPIDIDLTTFSTLIPGLQAGRYDFIVAVVTVTLARAEQMLFTEPYLATRLQFAIKKGGQKITSLDDLKGRTISVNKGSAYDGWATANAEKYGFKFDRYESSTDAVQAVLSGHADANLSGNTFIAYTASKVADYQPDFPIKETNSVMAFPVRRDNVAFRDQLDDALKCLKKNGTVARLSEKWFGNKPGPEDIENVVDPGHGIKDLPGYDPAPHPLNCG